MDDKLLKTRINNNMDNSDGVTEKPSVAANDTLKGKLQLSQRTSTAGTRPVIDDEGRMLHLLGGILFKLQDFS